MLHFIILSVCGKGAACVCVQLARATAICEVLASENLNVVHVIGYYIYKI